MQFEIEIGWRLAVSLVSLGFLLFAAIQPSKVAKPSVTYTTGPNN